MKAICIQARADSIVPSKSFANLREQCGSPRRQPVELRRHCMPLPALDLLASIVTPWTTRLRRLDRLRIDNHGGWRRFPPGLLARVLNRKTYNLSQNPAVPQFIKSILHGRVRRKVPLAYGARDKRNARDKKSHLKSCAPVLACDRAAWAAAATALSERILHRTNHLYGAHAQYYIVPDRLRSKASVSLNFAHRFWPAVAKTAMIELSACV
jgi:hypothetical protein